MLREGYQTCSSCHVSPVGGGALSPYGRMISEEVLSASFYKGEANPDHMDNNWPEWLAIGGDTRNLNMETRPRGSFEDYYHYIPMQRDIELGLKLGNFWFSGSYGQYGLDAKKESRRHSINYLANDNLGFRLGKFMPAYGLMEPDHTAFNRTLLGLGEGDESYNLEASARNNLGEIFLTGIGLTKEKEDSYSYKKNGVAGRLTYFALKTLQLGASIMYLRELDDSSLKFGGFFSAAFNRWLFLSSDINEELKTAEPLKILSYSKVSAEAYRGVNIIYENNYSNINYQSVRQNNVGFDIFPRPHLEFLGKIISETDAVSYLIMSHYYF